MSRILLLVGAGGLIVSIARYLTASYFTKAFTSSFPYGTIAVNIVGCLIIVIIYGLSDRWRLFLATGICRGFTTFSFFTLEKVKFLHDGNYQLFFLYSIGSLLLGMAAVLGGLALVTIK